MPSELMSASITDQEFRFISEFMYRNTGVRLASGKELLVMSRLDRRLRELGLASYGEYFRLLRMPGQHAEARRVVDLLTTNETSFFREPKHFEFLHRIVVPAVPPGRTLRVWSAASSTGEEAYTAAMILAEAMPAGAWEIIGTDISSRVVRQAQCGIYPIQEADRIPKPLLRRYLRKGREDYDGMMAVVPELRARVRFIHANLMDDLRTLGQFDVILLRNVMIYFDAATKEALIARLEQMLRPGGYLMIGHSESLTGLSGQLRLVDTSIYRSLP